MSGFPLAASGLQPVEGLMPVNPGGVQRVDQSPAHPPRLDVPLLQVLDEADMAPLHDPVPEKHGPRSVEHRRVGQDHRCVREAGAQGPLSPF